MSSERDDLRAMVRDLLTDRAGPQQVRTALDRPEGHDPALWRTVVELGLAGLLVPEEYGGAGAEFADMAVVLHELGRGVVPLPILSSGVLAATALTGTDNRAVAAELLPGIAVGERTVAVAVGGPDGRPSTGTWEVRATPVGRGTRLDGVSGYVVDAVGSDSLIVGAVGPQGPVLAAIDSAQARIEHIETVDRTRRLGRVVLTGVEVGADRLLAGPGVAGPLIERVQRAGALAVAVSGLGLVERTTEETAAYAAQRHQFGRAIGSYQAVKHKCADMAIAVECSRAAVGAALDAWNGPLQEAAIAVATAKAYAGDAALSVCGDAVQVHGGIGFTWEHDAHLWLKRATSDAALFGSSAWHRRRVADLVLLPAATEAVLTGQN
ncbi:acyl-CoA dehydrogenase family protein [Streptomyces sp. NPDC005811]|uniref:acyl-CoA dehydrogenase family protein n=1 Tax=Streptomyces sp. NPDC005811 TaxID=3154565 RepID=UPI0033ED6F8B